MSLVLNYIFLNKFHILSPLPCILQSVIKYWFCVLKEGRKKLAFANSPPYVRQPHFKASFISLSLCHHIMRHYYYSTNFIYFFPFIFISWRLISLQYCSGFCLTLTWISCGFTCILHPDPPSHLPLHPIPLGLPSAPGLSTCLMHSTWAGDLFHPR